MSKVKKHYIDNEKFSEESAKHAALFREHRANGLPPPMMSNYLGSCVLLLATKIANMPSFSGYSFKQEMVSDAIEIAIRYYYNYNPEVLSERTGQPSAGAHAWLTQVMVRRMFKTRSEFKLQLFVKQKYISESEECFVDTQNHDDAQHAEGLKDVLLEMSGLDFVEYDQKQATKKAELKAKQLTKKELNAVVKLDAILPMAAFFE